METNIDLLIFLSAIQLRILVGAIVLFCIIFRAYPSHKSLNSDLQWSMLIGTFSALAVVNYDLVDPFMGSYNVVSSVDQVGRNCVLFLCIC